MYLELRSFLQASHLTRSLIVSAWRTALLSLPEPPSMVQQVALVKALKVTTFLERTDSLQEIMMLQGKRPAHYDAIVKTGRQVYY